MRFLIAVISILEINQKLKFIYEMQHQLDYYKAQTALLGVKPNPANLIPLDSEPKYEDFLPSPDFVRINQTCSP